MVMVVEGTGPLPICPTNKNMTVTEDFYFDEQLAFEPYCIIYSHIILNCHLVPEFCVLI